MYILYIYIYIYITVILLFYYFSLYEVRLDVADYDATSNEELAMVEECQCPAQYFGTSCQV